MDGGNIHAVSPRQRLAEIIEIAGSKIQSLRVVLVLWRCQFGVSMFDFDKVTSDYHTI